MERAISLLLCLLVLSTSLAQERIPVSDGFDDVQIDPRYYKVVEDTSASLTIADLPFLERLPASPDNRNIRNVGSAYWLFFAAGDDSGKQWFLEFLDPHHNEIDVYCLSGDSLIRWERAGMDHPFEAKVFWYKNFLYPIEFLPGEDLRFVARIKSDTRTSFLFKFRSIENLLGGVKREYHMLGFFYGIILITIITNLILFLFIREKIYAYYMLYLCGSAMLFLSEDALGFEYLWPEFPAINHVLNFYSPILLVISFWLYSNSFLRIENYLSRYKIWFRTIIAACVVYFLANALLQSSLVDYRFYIVPFAMIFVAGIAIWRRGSRSARYFVLAHSFMLVGILFMVLRKSGIDFLQTPYTYFSLHAGFILEISILSYALGERISEFKSLRIKAHEKLLQQMKSKQDTQRRLVEQLRENERLKDRLNQDLEREVEKRSREIINQSEIIQKQNLELKEANRKLLEQADQINRLNEQLDLDNWALKNNIKTLTEARILSKAVDFAEFSKLYPDQNSCLKFLADKKWSVEYQCRKCGSGSYCAGRTPYSRRCTRCRYEESATAYTLLHKCKIPLEKAFYAIFLIFSSKGKITSVDLSNKLSIRQSTCWAFMNKINAAMDGDKRSWQKGWDAILIGEEVLEDD